MTRNIETDTIKATYKNLKSSTRVTVESPLLVTSISIVPPPENWKIDSSKIQEFTHLNMKIEKIAKIALRDAGSILGETQRGCHLQSSAESYQVSSLI